MKIKMQRTFYPVGQGGFYSESFKTENNNYILQGINREVFKTAEDIIQNILLLWETCPKNNIQKPTIPITTSNQDPSL